MAASSRARASWADVAGRAESDRLEILDGQIVEKAAPSPDHASTEFKLAELIGPFNRRPGGPRGPGGWWLFTEIHGGYASGEVYCHDIAGWRRDTSEARPSGWPVQIRPDWVCEIASPNHEKADLVIKPRTLHAAQVPHYWVLDPEAKILLVHRWSRDGYVVVQRATSGETIRAEPFDAIELDVGDLFGDSDDS